MTRRSKDIGTDCERAVARYLAANGWPSAEIRRTHGSLDLGDITGTPGLIWEVKGGHAAEQATDADITAWLEETELERSNAEALEKIQEVMLKIITDIAKDRKANLVFQRSELVLFDQNFDVTDEVLQKLDEQLPTLTVNFVAPAPSNPATAAQPAPASAQAAPKKKK